MYTTAYDIALRFTGIKEVAGTASNPQIMAMLSLDQEWPDDDEVPWCSAFINYVAWLLRLPRSKNLRARSWLEVGWPVSVTKAIVGFDVVVLSRGQGEQPGPEVIKAPGHVGLFSGIEDISDDNNVCVLGGNQANTVSVAPYPIARVLGIRRLWEN